MNRVTFALCLWASLHSASAMAQAFSEQSANDVPRDVHSLEAHEVPAPSTAALFGLGAAGIFLGRRMSKTDP